MKIYGDVECTLTSDRNVNSDLCDGNDSESDDDSIHEKLTENSYIGKKFDVESKANTNCKIFRIQGCNPNGFNLSYDGGDFGEFCSDMREYGIDMSCISEINLDTTNHKVRQIIQESASKQFDRKVRVQMASSRISTKNFYKPGGVMTLTSGNVSGRVIKSGSDKMGRWSYQYLTCKENRCIVIVTAYQPCKQYLISAGRISSNTVSAQQMSMMLLENDD